MDYNCVKCFRKKKMVKDYHVDEFFIGFDEEF